MYKQPKSDISVHFSLTPQHSPLPKNTEMSTNTFLKPLLFSATFIACRAMKNLAEYCCVTCVFSYLSHSGYCDV